MGLGLGLGLDWDWDWDWDWDVQDVHLYSALGLTGIQYMIYRARGNRQLDNLFDMLVLTFDSYIQAFDLYESSLGRRKPISSPHLYARK